MRFIDGNQAHAGIAEQRQRLRHGEALWREIEEAQLAVCHGAQGVARFGVVVTGIERGGGNAVALQLRDLIPHQRDERRNHECQPIAEECRELIAQRLAPAGRHDGQHIAARKHGADDVILAAPEGVKAENGA